MNAHTTSSSSAVSPTAEPDSVPDVKAQRSMNDTHKLAVSLKRIGRRAAEVRGCYDSGYSQEAINTSDAPPSQWALNPP